MNLYELLTQETGSELDNGKIYGVVVGIVTSNQDPDKQGRVKVQYPWLSDKDESHWARIATLMAGKDRGSFVLPEVDDEVLLAFEHGDRNFPYVIGALWNGKDTPHYDNADGKNNLRVFTSRSGHELIFDDSDGKEQVKLHTKAGHQLLLDDSSGQAQVKLHTKAGHQILLDDSSGQEKISVKDKSGNNSILIDSMQNAIAISSQMKLSLKAQTIEIEAGATMTIKSSGTLTIQGTLVKIN
jgi:uncharacterized protein involved in type VI secretion and phage assembly